MERIDELLDLALDSGEIPAKATLSEREQLLAMLASASVLRAAADEAEDESRASLPIARARFERFVDAHARGAPIPPVVARAPRHGLPGWLGPGPRKAVLALAGAALLLVVVVVGARRLAFDSAATAEALTPGDYVQVQGTISSATYENGARVFKVDSELGELTIDAALATPVVSDGADTDAASLAPGDSIVISGVVKEKLRVAAQTLALARQPVVTPRRLTFRELKELRPDLSGRVVVLTLSADGTRGRVLIETATGERLLVTVDTASAGRLLELTAALGARVSVGRKSVDGSGPFSLDVSDEPPAPASPVAGTPPVEPTRPARPQPSPTPASSASSVPNRPALVTVRGVILARTGLRLLVRTADGQRTVLLRGDTRILAGESGLLVEAIRGGQASAVGHAITVTGAAGSDGNMVADVIVIGPKPAPGSTR